MGGGFWTSKLSGGGGVKINTIWAGTTEGSLLNLLKNRFSSLALSRLPPQLLITLRPVINFIPLHMALMLFSWRLVSLYVYLHLLRPAFSSYYVLFRVILVPRIEDHLLWPSFHWRSCTLDTPSDVLPALKAPFILLMRTPALAQQCSNHKSEQKLPPREREMWCLEKMHLSCSNTPDTLFFWPPHLWGWCLVCALVSWSHSVCAQVDDEYWSVCNGLQYTITFKFPLLLMEISQSKLASLSFSYPPWWTWCVCPLRLTESVNYGTSWDLFFTQVSPTYLNQWLRGVPG